MNAKKSWGAPAAVAAAALLVCFLFLALVGGNLAPSATAAPPAIPTPVSVTAANPNAKVLMLHNAKVITAAGNTAWLDIAAFQKVDLHWVIDQGTVANTTTLKLQFSNDGVNAVDGATFVTANAADAGDMQQYALFGRFLRVNNTAGTSQPVTITLVGLAK